MRRGEGSQAGGRLPQLPQPYDVQELCKYHIHEVFNPDEEQDAKIKDGPNSDEAGTL